MEINDLGCGRLGWSSRHRRRVQPRRSDLPQTHDSLAASSPERLAALERGKCVGHALRPRLFAFG